MSILQQARGGSSTARRRRLAPPSQPTKRRRPHDAGRLQPASEPLRLGLKPDPSPWDSAVRLSCGSCCPHPSPASAATRQAPGTLPKCASRRPPAQAGSLDLRPNGVRPRLDTARQAPCPGFGSAPRGRMCPGACPSSLSGCYPRAGQASPHAPRTRSRAQRQHNRGWIPTARVWGCSEGKSMGPARSGCHARRSKSPRAAKRHTARDGEEEMQQE